MKWFKHHSNSHKNLKFQTLIEKQGWEGYGRWWVCVELIAEQGKKYHIKPQKNWKNYLKSIFKINEDTLNEFLDILANSELIDKNKIKKGILCIPKLSEYCDAYADKLRILSRQSRTIEEKRREENRKEENRDLEYYKQKTREFKRRNKLP